jgi:hypothetical protein
LTDYAPVYDQLALDAIQRTAARIRGRTRPVASAPTTWTGQDVIDWIQSEFIIPETHGPMPLAPYQQVFLREAHRRDADGKFVYDLVLWSDIKKSIKSCIAAAVILFRALHTEYGSFHVIANDLKQADSRVFYYIRRALELNPKLAARATIKNYKIALDNHSVIEAIPVDPKGEAGGNDDLIEWTELHAAESKAALAMWSEMTLSPTKFGYSQRWADTYAGFSGESPILEPLYDKIVKNGKRLDLGIPDLEVYASGKMLALWNTVPRLAWQTQDYYASEADTLLPNEFDRIHKNQWGTSTLTFVPGEWWMACRGDIKPFGKYREIVVGIDAAVSGDCFGIVGVSRSGDKVELRYARKWTPPPGGKITYSNVEEPDDVTYPEGELRRLAREYNVIAFGYDPYQLHHLCTSLENDNVGYFRPFNQGADRLKADKQLYDVIRDRRFVHDGSPDLTEHIQNANAKTEGDKLRIVKRSDSLKIDLAVCASMATDLAYELLPE